MLLRVFKDFSITTRIRYYTSNNIILNNTLLEEIIAKLLAKY